MLSVFSGGLLTVYSVYRYGAPIAFAAASQSLDLTLGTIKEVANANSEPGIVVDQNPPFDRVVARGERVDLTVTGKSTQVTLPNLLGTHYASAQS